MWPIASMENEKLTCICGSILSSKKLLARHKKTEKHRRRMSIRAARGNGTELDGKNVDDSRDDDEQLEQHLDLSIEGGGFIPDGAVELQGDDEVQLEQALALEGGSLLSDGSIDSSEEDGETGPTAHYKRISGGRLYKDLNTRWLVNFYLTHRGKAFSREAMAVLLEGLHEDALRGGICE